MQLCIKKGSSTFLLLMTSTSLLLEKDPIFFQALPSVTSGSHKPKILSASSPDQIKHCDNL